MSLVSTLAFMVVLFSVCQTNFACIHVPLYDLVQNWWLFLHIRELPIAFKLFSEI